MAAKVNELFQAVLDARGPLEEARDDYNRLLDRHADAKSDYQTWLRRQAAGSLSPTEASALSAAEASYTSLEGLIGDQRRRVAGLEKKAAAAEREHQEEVARLAAESDRLRKNPSGRIPGTRPVEARRGGVGLSYADLFGAPESMRAEGWERGAEEFFGTLGAGLHHPALRPVAAAFHNEGVGSEGGVLVPTELVARLFDQAIEAEPVLRLVTIEPMTAAEKIVAGFTSEGHSASGPFGFVGGWLGEGDNIAVEKALLRSIKLKAKKLALLSQASNEVASDGLGFGAQLEAAMRAALGWLLADAVFNGSGAGQPLGVLSGPSTIVVAKETSQVADTIVYENLVKMLARLLPSAQARAVWFASHTARPQLMQLSVVIGTSGTFIPLTVDNKGQYRLLGMPLYFTEHLPAVGDQGDIVLGDFSMYLLGLRQQMTLDQSQHVGFTQDLATFRGIVRADGQPVLDKPFTPKNGDTQAPFVTLATR